MRLTSDDVLTSSQGFATPLTSDSPETAQGFATASQGEHFLLTGDVACVNGQVAVPAGGQLKVPTPRVDQGRFVVVVAFVRASRMR
jgi:hypothetical protein